MTQTAILDSHVSSPLSLTIRWLTQLRWVAVVGQLLVIGTVQLLLQIPLPIVPLLTLVGWTAVTNFMLGYFSNQFTEVEKRELPSLIPSSELQHAIAHGDMGATGSSVMKTEQEASLFGVGNLVLTSVLCMDVFTLTGLLYFTGGGSNPFLIFYLANIAIAGMLLPRSLAWLVTLLSVACTAALLNHAHDIEAIVHTPLAAKESWGVPKFAFLTALATCSVVITYFISMLASEVRQREQQLAVAEQEKERSRRLEAMATLAAGAGHELATPLSTIAVVAKELSRNLEKYEVSQSIRRDVELIREELNRCRDILHRMKSGAGEAAAERLHPVSVQEIVHETVSAMREPNRVLVDLPKEYADTKSLLPKQALSQALRNLLQNGLDASPDNSNVEFSIRLSQGDSLLPVWIFSIRDRGTGLSEEVSRRIGEPFFTTKEVGKGMGLGVFLTRNVIHGMGGTIEFLPNGNQGTLCVVKIPLQT